MDDNKEIRLGVVVEGSADKKTSEKAGKDIASTAQAAADKSPVEVKATIKKAKTKKQVVDEIQSAVQSASVEIDISVPIDKTNKEISNAQKTFVGMYNNYVQKGVSATKTEYEALTAAFDRLKSKVKDAKITRKNPIYKEIDSRFAEIKNLRKLSEMTTTETSKESKRTR